MIGGGHVRQISHVNVPGPIARVLSNRLRLATMAELQTVYGVKDLYDMLEIIAVDAYNEYLARPTK